MNTPEKTSDKGSSEILAALCLLKEGKKDIFRFASSREQTRLEEISQSLSGENLAQKIRNLARWKKHSHSMIDELHPGWIVEKLRKEPRSVLNLLCRFLEDKKKVASIHEILSSRGQTRLPDAKETQDLPSGLVETVREGIEKKIRMNLPDLQENSFSFSHLVWMTGEDLITLFSDLGLEEIRKAFHHVESKTLRVFLGRFSAREAREIKERLRESPEVSLLEKQTAQKHLLTLSLDGVSSNLKENLFCEIGYSVFSQILSREDLVWAENLYQKIHPEKGYRLKRVILENHQAISSRSKETWQKKQDALLKRLLFLSEKGKIRRYWKAVP